MNYWDMEAHQRRVDRILEARDHTAEFLKHHPEYKDDETMNTRDRGAESIWHAQHEPKDPATTVPAFWTDPAPRQWPEPEEPPLFGFTPWQIVAMVAVVALCCGLSSIWKMGFAS